MNHVEELSKFGSAYAVAIGGLINDVQRICDPKHRVEKQQDLDKIIHLMLKVSERMNELNNWLTVFGSPNRGDDHAKNP